MHRRQFLGGVGGSIALGLAGCMGILEDGDSSGPKTPVENLASAYADGDVEAAQAAVHSEGPLSGSISQGTVESRSLELANTTVVEEPQGDPQEATVEADVTIDVETDSWAEPQRFVVREQEGDWLVWSRSTGPELAVDEYVAAVDADRVEEAAGLLHRDSPDRSWAGASVIESASLSLVSREQAVTGPTEASVEVEIEETVGDAVQTWSDTASLRRAEGGWRVWSLPFGPVRSVRSYVRALGEGNVDLLEALTHPENPDGTPDRQEVQFVESSSVGEVYSADVTGSGAAAEATVDAEITVSALGQEATQRITFVLRPHEAWWALVRTES